MRDAQAATAAEQAKAQRAAEKAAQDLANAQQAVRDAQAATAAEQTKAQKAAEKAARDLAAAQQAVRDAQAATAAEQAKAQQAAEKAAQDLANAQQAVRDAQAATAAEKAKSQQAAEKAAQDLAAAQQAVRDAQAATAAEQAKAQRAAEKAAQDLAIARRRIEETAQNLARLQQIYNSTKKELNNLKQKEIVTTETSNKPYDTPINWRKYTIENTTIISHSIEGSEHNSNLLTKENNGVSKVGGIYKRNDLEITPVEFDFSEDLPDGETVHFKKLSATHITKNSRNTFRNEYDNVGYIRYINQNYSSYANWNINEDGATLRIVAYPGFVSMPTKADDSLFKKNNVAVYHGHAISAYSRAGAEADSMKLPTDILRSPVDNFELTADFNRQIVNGRIFNRKEDNYKLPDVELSSTNIKTDPHSKIVYFRGEASVNSYNTDDEGNGFYSGHFAGPNAEEVVGRANIRYPFFTRYGAEYISFGGKKK